MKFADIEVGDTVYIMRKITAGWSRDKSFRVPAVVEKVTPKQFMAEGERYRKADGSLIKQGSYKYARLLADLVDGVEIVDETEQMNAFIENITHAYKIRDLADKLLRFDHQHPKLEKIHELVLKIEKLI